MKDMKNSADVKMVKKREIEEDAYWRNIDPSEVHFFAKVVPPDFHESLAIPMNYVGDNFTPSLRIALKLTSDKAWTVDTREWNGSLEFQSGWKEFVTENSLKENDILVFRYHRYGQVCFQMLLFDQTGYEKDSMHLEQEMKHRIIKKEEELIRIGAIKSDIKAETDIKEDVYLRKSTPARVHFFAKVLPKGFQESLAIPITYVRGGATVPARISLKLASDRKWTVAISERNGSLVFEHGWKKFAKENSLKESDILVFRYHTSPACLHVLLFDQTGFEKVNMQPESKIYRDDANDCIKKMQRKKNLNEAKKPKSEPVEISTNLQQETSTRKEREFKFTGTANAIFEPDIDSASNQCKILKRKTRRRDGNQAKRGRRGNPAKGVDETLTNQPHSGRSGRDDKVKGCKTACPQRPSAGFASSKSKAIVPRREEVIDLDSDEATDESYHVEAPINLRLSYQIYFQSQRRAVTEEERAKAKNSALALTSMKPNFISVMQPSHVQKRFFLTIPQELLRREIPRGTKEAIVRVPPNPKTWIVSLIIRKFSAGLNLGWANFVMDNNLEEGDVCLFELCGEQTCGRFLIDVSIFRVVEEVVPLKKVEVPYCMRGKKTKL